MKLSAFAIAAIATFAASQAHAQPITIGCVINDTQNNDVRYLFKTDSSNTSTVHQVGYMRNGGYGGASETWNISFNGDTLFMYSTAAPGWYIATFLNPNPASSKAALWHDRKVVGQGYCQRLDNDAPAPAPSGGYLPGSLAAKLGQ
jgi:hypothetical protein